jgi:hypothetical protein
MSKLRQGLHRRVTNESPKARKCWATWARKGRGYGACWRPEALHSRSGGGCLPSGGIVGKQ